MFIGMEKDYDSASIERTVIHLHILIILKRYSITTPPDNTY